MMPWSCSVPQCSANSKMNKGLSFHIFPHDEKRREAWLIAIRSEKSPSKYARVCSRHFSQEDFFPKEKHVAADIPKMKNEERQHLKPNVCPHLNLPMENYKKSGIRKKEGVKKKGKTYSILPKKSPNVNIKASTSEDVSTPSKYKRRKKILSPDAVVPSSAASPPSSSALPPSSPTQLLDQGVPGKIVIRGKTPAMQDSQKLLKLLKLPPNVVFNINSTSKAGKPPAVLGLPDLANIPAGTSLLKNCTSTTKETEAILPDMNTENDTTWIKQEPVDLLETNEITSDPITPKMTDLKAEPIESTDGS